MSQELLWLTMTALVTALLWIPYVLERIVSGGLWPALGNPSLDSSSAAPWAARAKQAHVNAVENLVIFAPLVIGVHIAGVGNNLTAAACLVFFAVRTTHFIVYTAGIPIVRTLLFAAGFFAQMALGLTLLGIL